MENEETEKAYDAIIEMLFEEQITKLGMGRCKNCPHSPKQFSPKPGDLVTVISPRGKSIFIYKSGECKKGKKVYCFAQLHHTNGFCDGEWAIEDKNNDVTDWHLSTKSDRRKFFAAMVKAGYKWNAKKLELKKKIERIEPKDGDFVVAEYLTIAPYLIIAKPTTTGISDYVWLCDGDLSMANTGAFHDGFKFRKQTDDEKKMLVDELEKEGKKWNPATKQIEDIKWRAEKGGEYWCTAQVNKNKQFGFYPSEVTDDRSNFDDSCFSQGDYHRTESDCQRLCDKLNSTIKNFK